MKNEDFECLGHVCIHSLFEKQLPGSLGVKD